MPAQVRGMKIFFNKAKYEKSHEGLNFISNSYHHDWGAFRTPTLREVANTAPYMRDGGIKTLDEVLEFYDKGGNWIKNRDAAMKRLRLTRDEKVDLVRPPEALPQ